MAVGELLTTRMLKGPPGRTAKTRPCSLGPDRCRGRASRNRHLKARVGLCLPGGGAGGWGRGGGGGGGGGGGSAGWGRRGGGVDRDDQRAVARLAPFSRSVSVDRSLPCGMAGSTVIFPRCQKLEPGRFTAVAPMGARVRTHRVPYAPLLCRPFPAVGEVRRHSPTSIFGAARTIVSAPLWLTCKDPQRDLQARPNVVQITCGSAFSVSFPIPPSSAAPRVSDAAPCCSCDFPVEPGCPRARS